jgi:hypothetical protein
MASGRGNYTSAGCLGMIVIVLVLLAIGLWLATVVIFYGWNWVLSPIFRLPEITWLQAFMLQLLLWVVGGFFKATVSK